MDDPRLRRHALGFWELDERPNDAALSAYYAEKYYQTEASNYRHAYPPEELEVIHLRVALRAARARELTGREQPGRLLDVGCGEGFVLAFYAREGWEVFGIDHSRAGVERMNPRYAERVEKGHLFERLNQRIADGETYDLVWLGNVLEHVLDPVGLLRELRELVAHDGLLVVTVPNDGNQYHEELYASGRIEERFWITPPDHISYFTEDSLRQTATATGWLVRDLQGDFPVDLYLAHEGSSYVRDRGRGPQAHAARLLLERLIGASGIESANRLYSALAGVGLGRNLIAYLAPRHEGGAG